MNFDKQFWIFIAAAMFFAMVASASTLCLASVQENFRECNSVSAACFFGTGMVPCMILGILALPPLMVAIPFIFGQHERPGLISLLVMGCIVACTALYAVNNVSAIMGYHNLYFFTHTLLDSTNNMTGTRMGTGESHC